MKSRLSRLLAVAGAAVLVTTACNVDPQQANQAAERVMTVAAQITPGVVETAVASSPLGTPAEAAPAEAPVVYARCITRSDTALLQLPNEGAPEMAALSSRAIITAYGRTNDAAWVLGWNAADVRGWIPASVIGCTAPVEELKPAAAGILLTPTVVTTVVPTVPTAPTIEATIKATNEATMPAPSGVLTNAVTATPETAAATETATLVPTETPLPATETSLPTATPAPTELPSTSTSTPVETATSASPVTVITVVVTATPAQVRDLRCTVTPGTPVNLRNGPARSAKLLDTLPAGTRFLAQGRNEDATWLYGFTERQMAGWLIASSLDCDGNVAQLVEVDR